MRRNSCQSALIVKEVIVLSKVLSKKRVGKIIIFALIIVSIYNIYVLIATNGIMKTARKVAAGEVTVESDTPYARCNPR